MRHPSIVKVLKGTATISYFGILFFVLFRIRSHLTGFVVPIWEMQNSENIPRILLKIFLTVSGVTALFIPLGVIILKFVNKRINFGGIYRKWIVAMLALASGIGCSVAVTMFTVKLSVCELTPLHLLLPSTGIVLGILAEIVLMLRASHYPLLGKGSLAAGYIFTALLGIVLANCFQTKPSPFLPSEYDSNDKRILVERLRHKDPRKFIDGQHQTIRLTWDEINKLFAWALEVGSGEKKAKVFFNRDMFTFFASIRVPVTKKISPYLNIELKGKAVYGRSVWVELKKLRIGRVTIPIFLLDPFYKSAYTILINDRMIRPIYSAIEHFELSDSGVCVRYGKVDVPEQFGSKLMARFGASTPLAPVIYGYLDRVILMGQNSSRITLKDCMETVFRHAKKKTAENGEPVYENQAAVFSLAILIGYERIGKLVGPVTLDDYPVAIVEKFNAVAIDERTDWARHFLLSAALQILSNIATSNAVGLLKEELDGDAKGSGFSFADYLADRAGTTFGSIATRDSSVAASLQTRIAEGFVVSDYFPKASDLPENIYDEDLISVYGGVGGDKYREIMETIEVRIRQCPAYKELLSNY